jgi:starvation-inducible DNA-binding protein
VKEEDMTRDNRSGSKGAEPQMAPKEREIQPFGSTIRMPIKLDEEARRESCDQLNQTLADTITLRDLYKKHHWQTSGPTYYQLHLLFDKHYEEQAKLVDMVAERIQLLGGISVAMAHDVAEMTKIPRPPRGREEPLTQITRLIEAHEVVIRQVREAVTRTESNEDFGTNDLLISNILRTNEMQVWFLSEHLVNVPIASEMETAR